MLSADGSDEIDTRRRIDMAVSRCGQLRFTLGAENIKLQTKVMIYKCAVGSLFTYGSEAWNLSEKILENSMGPTQDACRGSAGKREWKSHAKPPALTHCARILGEEDGCPGSATYFA